MIFSPTVSVLTQHVRDLIWSRDLNHISYISGKCPNHWAFRSFSLFCCPNNSLFLQSGQVYTGERERKPLSNILVVMSFSSEVWGSSPYLQSGTQGILAWVSQILDECPNHWAKAYGVVVVSPLTQDVQRPSPCPMTLEQHSQADLNVKYRSIIRYLTPHPHALAPNSLRPGCLTQVCGFHYMTGHLKSGVTMLSLSPLCGSSPK